MCAGVKGNLLQIGFILANLVATASAIPLTVYFLAWQTYVMKADVIFSSVLLVAFGLDGLLAIAAFTQLASWETLKLSLEFRGWENWDFTFIKNKVVVVVMVIFENNSAIY